MSGQASRPEYETKDDASNDSPVWTLVGLGVGCFWASWLAGLIAVALGLLFTVPDEYRGPAALWGGVALVVTAVVTFYFGRRSRARYAALSEKEQEELAEKVARQNRRIMASLPFGLAIATASRFLLTEFPEYGMVMTAALLGWWLLLPWTTP